MRFAHLRLKITAFDCEKVFRSASATDPVLVETNNSILSKRKYGNVPERICVCTLKSLMRERVFAAWSNVANHRHGQLEAFKLKPTPWLEIFQCRVMKARESSHYNKVQT